MEIKVRRWKNKTSGKEFNVLPWWDCRADIIDKPTSEVLLKDKDEDWKDRLYAIGVLAQIGWLLEAEDGVWFGVGPKAKDHFDEMS
jgi:hypothetical protein